jgi:hypothetical protein
VRYRVIENAPATEARESVSLIDQNKTSEDEKSKINSKALAAAQNDNGKHSDRDDRNHRTVRHHKKHRSRE